MWRLLWLMWASMAAATPDFKFPVYVQVEGFDGSPDAVRVRTAIIRRLRAIPDVLPVTDEGRSALAIRVTIAPIGFEGQPVSGVAMAFAYTSTRIDCDGRETHAGYLTSGVLVSPTTATAEEETAFLIADQFDSGELAPLRQAKRDSEARR